MTADARIAVCTEDGECVAIYMPHPSKKGLLKPAKVDEKYVSSSQNGHLFSYCSLFCMSTLAGFNSPFFGV
jgi:hypothetical protein